MHGNPEILSIKWHLKLVPRLSFTLVLTILKTYNLCWVFIIPVLAFVQANSNISEHNHVSKLYSRETPCF